MRKDLAKCTTESPRHGQGYASAYKIKYGGTVRIHPDPEHDYLDEYGGYRPSGRGRQWESKSFSDCLGALRGNIRKNVGRPWNDVFSEFSQLLDRRSLSGYHIWTHLMQEVETKTVLVDGEVYSRGARWGYRRGRPLTGYYVHPITGILKYVPHVSWRSRRNKKTPIDKIQLPVPGTDGWKYCLTDGLWFRERVTMSERGSLGYRYKEMVVEKKSANKKEITWIKAQLMQWGYEV